MDAFINSLRGDLAAASTHAQAALELRPDDHLCLRILSVHDRQTGDGDVAVERYESAYPALASRTDPAVDASNWQPAIHFASLLKATGDEDRANLLLDRALAVTERLPQAGEYGIGINAAQIHALKGQTEEALAALRQAVDAGTVPIFSFNPDFASLSDDPRYQAIRAEMDAELAAQLANALQMEADGELEPLPE